MDDIPQPSQPNIITAKPPFPKKPLIIFTVILSLFVTLLILNSLNLLPAFSLLSSGTPPQNQSGPVSKPSPSPTPLNISLSCPVPEEFCTKGQEIDNQEAFFGLGFNLPEKTSVLAAFEGKIEDRPKVKARASTQPLLYLRDSQGKEAVYSYYGTVSVKIGKQVAKGEEIGKIGPGKFPIAPLTGFNFVFSVKSNNAYLKINADNFTK